MKMRHNIGVLWIDYLQIIQGGKQREGTRNEEVASWCGALIKLKKQLNIPVVCLSQLSRGVEGVGTKGGRRRPRLSDLRDSGAIEQDADKVIALSQCEDDEDASLVEILKNRNGPLGGAIIKREFDVLRFDDGRNVQPENFMDVIERQVP